MTVRPPYPESKTPIGKSVTRSRVDANAHVARSAPESRASQQAAPVWRHRVPCLLESGEGDQLGEVGVAPFHVLEGPRGLDDASVEEDELVSVTDRRQSVRHHHDGD